MSKNKVIVLALLEGGMSKSQADATAWAGNGSMNSWLGTRLRATRGLEPQSRKPRTNLQDTDPDGRARIPALRTERPKKGSTPAPTPSSSGYSPAWLSSSRVSARFGPKAALTSARAKLLQNYHQTSAVPPHQSSGALSQPPNPFPPKGLYHSRRTAFLPRQEAKPSSTRNNNAGW